MTGHGRNDGTIWRHLIHQKVEDKAASGIGITVGMREAEPQDRIKQMTLRLADTTPLLNALLRRNVGHKAIVAAGRAKCAFASRGHRPVADIVHFIGAKPHLFLRFRDDLPVRLTGRGQRLHGQALRHEGKTMTAGNAKSIVEMHRLAAGCAGKKLHR
ncbi:hypothetical protein QE372_001024 [Agrobacterium pusense]|nr:hypothetical protein [Agrobacterium pusense]